MSSDTFLDTTLRPASWDEYIGQDSVKNNLHILISAAKERDNPPEHVLFYGPPGLRKDTPPPLDSPGVGRELEIALGARHRTCRRPRRTLNQPRPRRHFVYRRDPPPAAINRRGALPGDGERNAQHHHRQRPLSPHARVAARTLYPDCGNNSRCRSLGALAQPLLRRRVPPRVLQRRRYRKDCAPLGKNPRCKNRRGGRQGNCQAQPRNAAYCQL